MIFIKIAKITTNYMYKATLATNSSPQILRLLALIFCIASVSVLRADSNLSPAPLETYIRAPERVGEATLKVMLWKIFDAELYASGGDFDADKPFALALKYHRNFSSQSIVEETIKQIESQQMATEGAIAMWRSQLKSIIPDVQAGMMITGIRTSDGHTVFYHNGELHGRIEDQQFTRLFFNIWIGENSSEPELRRKLLGYTQS